MLDGIARQCRDPFGLFVCGEFNVGKSSLINAVSGSELCEVGVLPTTAEVSVAAGAGFTWVDSPGINSLFGAHQERTEQYVTRADAVLFVTSVERPVTQSELNFLKRIAITWRKQVVVAVNKIDLLSDDEARLVLQFVADGLANAGIPVQGVLGVSSSRNVGIDKLKIHLLKLCSAEGIIRLKQAAISDALTEVSRIICGSITQQLDLLQTDLRGMDQRREQMESRLDVGRRLFAGNSPGVELLFAQLSERFEALVDERMQVWKSLWSVARRDKAAWEGRLVGIIHELGVDNRLRDEVARLAERLEIFLQAFNELPAGVDRSGAQHLSYGMPEGPLFHPGAIAQQLQEASQRAASRFVTGGSCAALSGISVKLSSVTPIEIGGIFLMAGFGLYTLKVFPSQKKRFKRDVLELISGAKQSFERGLAEGVEGVFGELARYVEMQAAPVRNATEQRRDQLQEILRQIMPEDPAHLPVAVGA
jgi:GTP-binding protein EngB required for normal cell division